MIAETLLLLASIFFLIGAWKFANEIGCIQEELKQITKQLIYLNDKR